MKLIMSLLLIVTIILAGCSYLEPVEELPKVEDLPEGAEVSDVIEEPIEEPVIEEPIGCMVNADCEWNQFCIDGECGTIAEIYVTEGCTEKCNFNSVVVETSDSQTFTLNRGQGDYTAAGAIEWTLASGPDYCKGSDDIIVPVKIKKKNMGKVISEEYRTVLVGKTSEIVTHPTMAGLEFTFKIKSVNEVCG
jgi:hypothetical protein